jgi:uncharacterized protein (DUF1501 family)
MSVACAAFTSGLSRSVLIYEDLKCDTHAPDDAKNNPARAAQIAARIKAVIEALRSTPYDSQRSLLDVTTFVFGTEFGRTMRQLGSPIGETGTDHGNLSNSVVIGGKGIKGGWIVGESDFAAADEKLSDAHLSVDSAKVKTMGRPFDFATCAPKSVMPQAYDAADYLTIGSVVNTIYSTFEVPQDRFRLLGRNGPVAPVLSGFLS